MTEETLKFKKFSENQIITVNSAVEMAEELVSNFYKMSASQWLKPKYDIKTLVDLSPEEILNAPFAQIIRYKGQRKNTSLGSSAYDFYKICLQDHCILLALEETPGLELFPFALYIVTHELIHIVRFSKFLQNFDASPHEKIMEEARVHEDTHQILRSIQTPGISAVLDFYHQWRQPFDKLYTP
jgi:hypothetical protein